MDTATEHIEAMNYERFLKRVFRNDSRIHRPSKSEFLNLINAERGIFFKVLGSQDDQMAEIKNRLTKAINFFIEKTVHNEMILRFTELLSEVETASSSEDIIKIVKKGLCYTQQYK